MDGWVMIVFAILAVVHTLMAVAAYWACSAANDRRAGAMLGAANAAIVTMYVAGAVSLNG
jgi:hypothetical protein